MYQVFYSSDEHDSLYYESNDLFESTCEFYYMLDDLENNEWITIFDEDNNTLKIT